MAKFIYILKNYGGQDLGEFIKDLKEHMAIKVTTDGGVDKSSPQYAAAFQEAQEVFGIFDAIARMNNKAQTPAAQAAAPPAPPAPVQREDVFEKIRQLGRLREEKLLTEEEFAAKKKALMEQIR